MLALDQLGFDCVSLSALLFFFCFLGRIDNCHICKIHGLISLSICVIIFGSLILAMLFLGRIVATAVR